MAKPIVFLSHSSKDSAALIRLKAGLEVKTNGTIDFFLTSDGESIPFGRNWIATIQNALDNAKLAFVFLSPHSVGSGWVHFESGFMYAKNIAVVPVGMPKINLAKVPPPLGLLQGFNVHSHESLNNLFSKINQTFETKHNNLFSADDYQNIFSNDISQEHFYFGVYTNVVDLVYLTFSTPTPCIPQLESALAKRHISAHIGGPMNDSSMSLSTYGLIVRESKKEVSIELSPDMAGLALELLSEALESVENNIEKKIFVFLSSNVGTYDQESKRTGKFYGTEIKIARGGAFAFKEMTFGMRSQGNQQLLQLNYCGRLRELKLNELISLLFELGILFETAEITPSIS